MKIVKKKTEGDVVMLDVTVTTSEVSEALNQAQIQFCNQMGLHPQKGKTPAEVASAQLGIKDLDEVVSPQAMDAFVPRVLDKQNIIPAFTPTPNPQTPLKRGHTYKFELVVTGKPRYELKSYDPIEFRVQRYTSDESAIDEQIKQMAENYATYVATDPKAIGKGDNVLLAIECNRKGGERVDGLCTDGRTYSIGIGLMPEGFDKGIEGMQPGDTRSFEFEGPDIDDDGNEITETYEATVTLKEVQKKQIPEIDDAWVQKNMPMYHNLEDLRKMIGGEIDRGRRRQYDDYVRNVAAAELAKRFDGKIEDAVYEGSMRELQKEMRQQVAQQGMTFDQFVEQNGGEQQVSMMMMMETRQRLVQGYALDALYRHAHLQFTDEDLDEVCVGMNPQAPGRARQAMEQSGFGFALRESAERLRACKYLVEHATITYTDPDNANVEAETVEKADEAEKAAQDADAAADASEETVSEK